MCPRQALKSAGLFLYILLKDAGFSFRVSKELTMHYASLSGEQVQAMIDLLKLANRG